MDIATEDKLVRVPGAAPSLVQFGEARTVPLSPSLVAVEGVLPCGGLVGGVSLWVTSIHDGGAGLATPSDVEWQLYARFGRYVEAIPGASSTATWPDNWSSSGLLVQVANVLCEGFELHARSMAGGDALMRLRWMVAPGVLHGLPAVHLGVL